MKIKVKFCELPGPLFLAGKNFGTKLDTARSHGLTLTYDREQRELYVQYEGKFGVVPYVSMYEPMDPKDFGIEAPMQNAPQPATHRSHAIDITKIASAQVSNPHDVVFAGPGAVKVIKRPAKVQGE